MASARGLALGVDAGGSKTDALVCTADGTALGYATAGPGNWETIGLDGMRAALEAARRRRARGGGRRPRRRRERGLRPRRPRLARRRARVLDEVAAASACAGRRVLVNDAFLPLRAGCRTACAIASSAGTGSVACGRDAAGRSVPHDGASASASAVAPATSRTPCSTGSPPPTTASPRRRRSRSARSPPPASASRPALFEAASRGDARLAPLRPRPARARCGRRGRPATRSRSPPAAGAALGRTVAGVAGAARHRARGPRRRPLGGRARRRLRGRSTTRSPPPCSRRARARG